jgi:hypothetical protein
MKFSLFRLVPVFLFIIGLVALWLGENLFLLGHRRTCTRFRRQD